MKEALVWLAVVASSLIINGVLGANSWDQGANNVQSVQPAESPESTIAPENQLRSSGFSRPEERAASTTRRGQAPQKQPTVYIHQVRVEGDAGNGQRAQPQRQPIEDNRRNQPQGGSIRYQNHQRGSSGNNLPPQVRPGDIEPSNLQAQPNQSRQRLGAMAEPLDPVPLSAPVSLSPLALAGKSEGQLATNMMAEIGQQVKDDNIIINPFGIWTIALMVFGVAGGNTAKELATLLGSDLNPAAIETAYMALNSVINKRTDQVESKTLNLIVRKDAEALKSTFAERLRSVFNAEEFKVKSWDQTQVSQKINRWAANSTKNRITQISKPDDLTHLKILLGSAAFFKGKWKYPFNATATSTDEFKDENDQIISSVPMMRTRAILKYAYSPQLESQIVEIPYGDDMTSMVVILPRRKVLAQKVLDSMKGLALSDILPRDMAEEEVELSLPRFSSTFSAILNSVFYHLGAPTFLNAGAELPGLSDQAFISKITHTAEIETSEEGTTASAITSAQVSYKTSSVSFHANRPFIYFINDIASRAVLFAGKYSNPAKP